MDPAQLVEVVLVSKEENLISDNLDQALVPHLWRLRESKDSFADTDDLVRQHARHPPRGGCMNNSLFGSSPFKKAACASPAAASHRRDAAIWSTNIKAARDTVGESECFLNSSTSGSTCPPTTNRALGRTAVWDRPGGVQDFYPYTHTGLAISGGDQLVLGQLGWQARPTLRWPGGPSALPIAWLLLPGKLRACRRVSTAMGSPSRIASRVTVWSSPSTSTPHGQRWCSILGLCAGAVEEVQVVLVGRGLEPVGSRSRRRGGWGRRSSRRQHPPQSARSVRRPRPRPRTCPRLVRVVFSRGPSIVSGSIVHEEFFALLVCHEESFQVGLGGS